MRKLQKHRCTNITLRFKVASKSKRRELRQQEKRKSFESSRTSALDRLLSERLPKAIAITLQSATPKISGELNQLPQDISKAIVPKSRFQLNMTWCTTQSDIEGAWSWGEARAWTQSEWETEILPKFSEYEKQKWAEIDAHNSGTGHKMHHEQEVHTLAKEAQDRWIENNLEQFETAFRFRLGGKKRAWGYRLQAHFHLVWWERNHKIYPLD